VARLEDAIRGADEGEINDALSELWREASSVGVITPLAHHFGPQMLDSGDLPVDHLTFKFLLLTDRYEEAALLADLTATDSFLAAVARGDPSDAAPARSKYPLVQQAFAGTADPTLVDMAAQGRTGEAILRTIATLQQGLDGDHMAFVEGFATLRALGLEDVARRVALQYLILE
jgi:hypothetical protein